MSEHINKSEIIKFFRDNKKNYRLDSNAFVEVFKTYMLDNKIGYHTMINTLNIAREKEAISKRAYERLMKVLEYDYEFYMQIEHQYYWNCKIFDKLMKESRYDEEEIFLMVRNLYAAGEITQNDVEQYAYFTKQIAEDIKKEKKEEKTFYEPRRTGKINIIDDSEYNQEYWSLYKNKYI